MAHAHGHHRHGHHATPGFDGLDDETSAFAQHWDEVLDWVALTAGDASTVLDLGTGNGVAAVGLARRLPIARVTAVDVRDTWFAALRERAGRAGVADRVRTVVSDIDVAIPVPPKSASLVFASNCLHHAADAAAVVRRVGDTVTDDGVLCVVEVARPVRLFAADDPAAAAETRVAEALGARLREEMPLHGAQWSLIVAENGWRVVDEREFATTADPSADGAGARYALRHLERLIDGSAGRAAPHDIALLTAARERARSAVGDVSWGIDGSRIAVLGRPARSADTR